MRLRPRRLAWLLVPLVVTAGLTVVGSGAASAADPSYPSYSSDPVHAYGEPPAGDVVTDVKVVTGTDPNVACPAGYTKRYPDLNRGLGTQLNGKLSDYVYTCLLFTPSANLSASNPGIGELYVSSPVTANCNGSDKQVDGDLNSGMVRFDAVDQEEKLFYCVHRPDTNGGSGFIIDPGEGVDYFPTPANLLLRDVQFLAWDPGSEPACDTTDCVDTSPVGAFAYLEAAQTFDPYCQRYFGSDYHPIFQPWEYYTYSGDKDSRVPQDSNAFNLNAGVLGKTMIYGCAAYTLPSANSVELTTPPARVGQTVNLKALVDPTDGGGSVSFASDGVTIPGCGAEGFISGGGTTWQAMCSTSSLPQGTHTVTARYSGDSRYGAASGTGQEVIAAPTSITMSTSGTARAGDLVDLKALVDPTDGGGSVSFASDGVTIPGCATLGFGSGGGTTWQAICSTSSLSQGTHTITATYSGDAGYASSSGSEQQTITANPDSFAVRLLSGANSALTLGVTGASTAPGARVAQSPSSGLAGDVWIFRPVGGSYELVNENSNLCLTTDGTAGDTLYQTYCIAADSQLWQVPANFRDGAFHGIQSPATGLYLDVFGGSGASGAAIDAWPWNGGYPNQSFLPVPA